jgi:hypothetical protein
VQKAVEAFFKVSKKDIASFPELQKQLKQLSATIIESDSNYLYGPSSGNMNLFAEKLKELKIAFDIISESYLYLYQ